MQKGVYGAQINPRGCENDLCINLNNCFQWDKAVCGKRKGGCCRSWILQRILERGGLSPVAGGETWDLSVLPRKHLNNPERCLSSLMATPQCKRSCVWALGMSIAVEKQYLRPLLIAQRGLYMQKGEKHPWGWWVLAAGHWQVGCARLLKASQLCPLQHYFNYPIKLCLYPL